MSKRVTLNEAQIALLRQLAAGCCISYSQDGEDGWLYPPNSRRVRGRLDDDDIWALRDAKFIDKADDPDDEYDEYVRFPSSDRITPAGRAYLSSLTERTKE